MEIIFINFEVCVCGIFTYTLNGVPENKINCKKLFKRFKDIIYHSLVGGKN